MVFGQNWVLSHAGLISMVFWSARDGILVLRDGIRVQGWYSGPFRSKTLKMQNTNTENVVLTVCLKTEWFVPQNSLAGQFVLCTQQTALSVLQSNTTSNFAVAQRCFRVLVPTRKSPETTLQCEMDSFERVVPVFWTGPSGTKA